jgi:hypothetical protein
MSRRKALPPDLKRPRPGVEPGTPQWAAWVQEIEDYLGYRVCGHKNRQGYPCALEPMKGRTRCKHGGGASLHGPANPAWKHGRQSQIAAVLPAALRDNYEALLGDPKLLQLESDIALTDLRQTEVLRQFFAGADPVGALQSVLAATEAMTAAVAEGNMERLAQLVGQVRDQAEAGTQGANLWDDWRELGEHKRRLMESEGKRLERMGAYMTAEQVRAYNGMVISALLESSEKHVPAEYRKPFLAELLLRIAAYSGITPQHNGQQLLEGAT